MSSATDFDPYRKWLGIPPHEQPPHHYRLLGVGLFETDPEVIQEAADRQMAHVRTHQAGPHSQVSQQILSQISLARICLLNPLKKSAYDDQLRQTLASQGPPPPPPIAPPQRIMPPVRSVAQPPITMQGAPGMGSGMHAPGMPSGRFIGQPAAQPMHGVQPMPAPQPMPTAQVIGPFAASPSPAPAPPRGPSVPNFSPNIKTEAAAGESVSDRYRGQARPAWVMPVVGGISFIGIIGMAVVVSSLARPNAPRRIAEGTPVERPVPGAGPIVYRIPPTIPQGLPLSSTRSGRAVRPAPPTVTDKVELLDLIDTREHALKGDWTFVGGNLLTPNLGVSRLRIPFVPPEEYKLSLIAERKQGENSLNIVLASGDVRFAVLLDARGGRVSGLHLVDDQTVMGNPTTYNGSVFNNKEPVPLVITVRKSGVKVTCDEKSIIDFKGKLSRLSMDTSNGETVDKKSMYIGSLDSHYLISRLELTPLEPDLTPPEPDPVPTPEPTTPERRSLSELVERSKKTEGSSLVPRGPRTPVPDAELRKAAALRVKEEVFKDQIAAAKKPPEKLALAKQLWKVAQETKDDEPSRFVLFDMAENLAAEAGEFHIAWQAIDEQAKIYDIRPIPLKQAALASSSKLAKSPGELKFVAEVAIYLVNEAVRHDEHELSLELADEAIAASRKAKDLVLLAWVQERTKDLREVRDEFRTRQKDRDKLATEPADQAANQSWGEFLCLFKHEWADGLPLWAKGTNPRAQFAARDLANPSADAARMTLADDWWSVAEGEKGLAQTSLKLRAAHWYRKLRSPLAADVKSRVEDRLFQASALELGLKKGEWVDILRLVDLSKHRVQGSWQREGADVAVRGSQTYDRFMIPVGPQGSYDLQVRFSRSAGDESFVAVVPVGAGACVVTLGANGGKISRLEPGGLSAVTATPGQFLNDRLHQVEIHVDATGDQIRMQVDFNGQPYMKWQGSAADVRPVTMWQFPKPGAIGIGTGRSNSMSIHGARLRLNSGNVLVLADPSS